MNRIIFLVSWLAFPPSEWAVLASTPSSTTSKGVTDQELFRHLFAQKRLEHHLAIGRLVSLDPEKREQLLNGMMDKFFSVMATGKALLENAGIGIGPLIDFPPAEEQKNGLALVMENTCFLSDILLRFPDYLHAQLKDHSGWALDYKWGLSFAAQSGDLIDEKTRELIHLACQEMGVGEPDPDYVNPYKAVKTKAKRFEDPPPPRKKTKKKLRKGPKLSRSEL